MKKQREKVWTASNIKQRQENERHSMKHYAKIRESQIATLTFEFTGKLSGRVKLIHTGFFVFPKFIHVRQHFIFIRRNVIGGVNVVNNFYFSSVTIVAGDKVE